MYKKQNIKMVVIGGGTGSFTLLTGLKNYTDNITALVNMADDGGSTGQLRDEFGVLPSGDVRQCLVALSNSPKARDLFNYRFDDGSLKGHAFGNLFLTALEKMTGSFVEGVELASQILDVTGSVEPITLTNVALHMQTADGKITKGQFQISRADFKNSRPKLWLEPQATLNPAALKAVERADIIVVAPGGLYSSLAPALIVPGVREALQSSHARKVYVCNLVTKPGQTTGFKVHDFAAEIERLVGAPFLDYVIYNKALPSDDLLQRYAHDGEFAVEVDAKALGEASYIAKGADMLADTVWHAAASHDPIAFARTLIRHDPDKVARALMKIYFE